ncbi:MAG: hypothetical protein GY772_24275, partial [bacterium]|nr:hypothetical protein [bacterium]
MGDFARALTLVVGLIGTLVCGAALASPLTYHQTGRMLDASGEAVLGSHNLTVRLYDSGDQVVWENTYSSEPFELGYYGVVLGTDATGRTLEQASTGLQAAVEVGLSLDGGAELSPRQSLHAVPRSATTAGATTRPGVAATSCVDEAGGLAYDSDADALVACVSGVWLPVVVDSSAESCAEILARDASATSDFYEIDPDGALGSQTPYMVECDMDTGTGGWTKVALHVGGTATSYFWSSSLWYDNRTTTGSYSSETTDHVSYAAFDVNADEVMVKRSSGAAVERVMDGSHQGESLAYWMSSLVGQASENLGTNLNLGRVYNNPVGLFVSLTRAEADAFFGVTFGAEHISQLRIFAYDRSSSGDPWHMWHGVQATINGVDGGNGCSQLPSPWSRRAAHGNGVTDVCYASTTADH